MRILIQRVVNAGLSIDGCLFSSIGGGMVVLVGIEEADENTDAEWLAAKLVKMRIFDDTEGVMNLSVEDTEGDIMVVSQFTLHASTRKGNRPSYMRAAKPEKAVPLYKYFITCIEQLTGKSVATGKFGADMQIALVNDGPVTIWIDSKQKE